MNDRIAWGLLIAGCGAIAAVSAVYLNGSVAPPKTEKIASAAVSKPVGNQARTASTPSPSPSPSPKPAVAVADAGSSLTRPARAVRPPARPNNPAPTGRTNRQWAPPPVNQPITAEMARVVLEYVGFEPAAEGIWLGTINDLSRPAKEREDLIEDLNETGFPDPDNITMEDLPLILSRIAIIERNGPDATDEVNVASFAEAYKDLLNMRARLTGQ